MEKRIPVRMNGSRNVNEIIHFVFSRKLCLVNGFGFPPNGFKVHNFLFLFCDEQATYNLGHLAHIIVSIVNILPHLSGESVIIIRI